MSTLVKTVGNGANSAAATFNHMIAKKAVAILSDGTVVAVIMDYNQTGITGDGGDNTGIPKMHIYTSTDRVNWTLRLTRSTGAVAGNNRLPHSVAVAANNTLHIAFMANSSKCDYWVCTYSGGGVFVDGGVTQVQATQGAGLGYPRVDIDVVGTGSGNPVIAIFGGQTSADTWYRLYTRTNGGAWVLTQTRQLIDGDSWYAWTDDIAIAGNKDATPGDNINTVVVAAPRKRAAGTDFGDIIYGHRINFSTGALVGSFPIKVGYNQNLGGGFRSQHLFSLGSDEYVFAGQASLTPWIVSLYKFSVSKTANTFVELMPFSNSPSQGNTIRATGSQNWTSVAYAGNGRFMFFARGTSNDFYGTIAKIVSNKATFQTGSQVWDDRLKISGIVPPSWIYAGANRNWAVDRIDTLMAYTFSGSTAGYQIRHHNLKAALAPDSISPVSLATVSNDRPTLGAAHNLSTTLAQARVKMQWQISTDSGFTTNVRTITEGDTDFVIANNTNAPTNAVVAATEAVSAANELNQGTWFIRARSVNEIDQAGAWSSGHSFNVSHLPVGTNLFPTGGAILQFGVSGFVTFTWIFSDPSPSDAQTAYQVIAVDEDDSTVVDSGKIVSTAQSVTLPIPAAFKDMPLRWRLRLWDSDDAMGNFSNFQSFYVATSPAPSITSPPNNGVLQTGTPIITWTSNLTGTKVQSAYRLLFTQGGSVAYDSGWVNSSTTTHTVPVGFLKNAEEYTITLTLRDNLDLEGSATIFVSTDWIPPLGPPDLWEVFISEYVANGFVYVTWDASVRDEDFSAWKVYRRTVGQVEWELQATYTGGQERLSHRDYLAGSGQFYEYAVTQEVNRFGDLVESDITSTKQVKPESDGYWLIDPLDNAQLIPLFQVTGDSFVEEYEEETYSVINRGRHVDYGDRLGYIGSLTLDLRDKALSSIPKYNYMLNPSFSFSSSGDGIPDVWIELTNGNTGDVFHEYVDPPSPPPFRATPYRLTATALENTLNDWIGVQQTLNGTLFPKQLAQANLDCTFSFWALLPGTPADKRYNVLVQWLDLNGNVVTSTDSGSLDITNPAHYVETSVGPTSDDVVLYGNDASLWRRFSVSTTTPGTAPAGVRITIKIRGIGSGATQYTKMNIGGTQLEIGGRTPYFDGEQIGSEWDSVQYLSWSLTTGYYTARNQRKSLELIKSEKRSVYMRNPFGDIWVIAPGNIGFDRLAGVGKMEAGSVDLPYKEVGF